MNTITREVALTEVMLNEQARQYAYSMPRVPRRVPVAAILGLLGTVLAVVWLYGPKF